MGWSVGKETTHVNAEGNQMRSSCTQGKCFLFFFLMKNNETCLVYMYERKSSAYVLKVPARNQIKAWAVRCEHDVSYSYVLRKKKLFPKNISENLFF